MSKMQSLTVKIPRWVFDNLGDYFLVGIHPDRESVIIDGGLASKAAVAKALEFYNRIDCIRPPDGTKFVMIRIEEVPGFRGKIDEGKIKKLNSFGGLQPALSGRRKP